MKKVIIGMLLILPLIIVASVLFAVDLITVQAYIAVESVELNIHELEIPLSDKQYTGFVANVYPSKAKTDIVWSIDNIVSTMPEYEGEIATIDPNTGVLSLFSYGTLRVIATTTIGNKQDSCNVYIKGDVVEGINISASSNNIKVGESLRLTTVFYPLDAVVKEINWTSSNPNMIKVDQNGIVTAVNPGSNIKISATTADNSVTGSIELNSLNGVSNYGDYFFIENSTVSLSSLGLLNVTISNIVNGTLENNNLSFINTNAPIIISTPNGNITIMKCEKDEVVIENYDILALFSIKVMKLPLVLNVVYKDVFRKNEVINNIQWTSSNPDSATISNKGVVTAIANGKNVRFTALIAGTNACSISLDVIKPISVLVLDKTEADDKRGIALTNIYGSKKVGISGLENNSFKIGVVFPSDVNIETDLAFSILDSTLATINNQGIITLIGNFNEKKSVTVIVKVINSPYESVSIERRYTFTVDQGVDCYSPADIYYATEHNMQAFMRQNMEFKNGDKTILLKNNLYGNGYLFSGVDYENKGDLTSEKSDRFNMITVLNSNVLVTNINIRNDDEQRINIPDGLQGPVIQVGWKKGEYIKNVRLEYSIFENGFYGVSSFNAEFEIDGCIIRNISNFGIHLPDYNDEISYSSSLLLNNTVLSQIIAPCIALTSDSPFVITMSSLTVTGFLDMYNWQPLTSMRMLDRRFVENDALNSLLKSAVTNYLATEFAKDKYNHIRYTQDDIGYLHLGIITAGALYEFDGEVIIEDPRIIKHSVGLTEGVLPIRLSSEVYIYLYTIDSDIKPNDEPIENSDLYARLRGE
ncbi:MAG: Ig-like domain-containing protein [Christensenellaceae bacterium]|jgi:uncharacterized protein YjdB|nr:Ig-like domain-containing protein [Christensenellaceae bacterium]